MQAVYTGMTLGGRYTVGALLGRGGWGDVYEALQIDLGRKVALKILHSDQCMSAALRGTHWPSTEKTSKVKVAFNATPARDP